MHVLLDTSIYRRDPKRRSAGFQALIALCKENAITLHVPTIVRRELITHLAPEAEGLLDETIRKLRDLARSDGPDEARRTLKNSIDELEKLVGKYGKHVEESFNIWLRDTQAVLHELRPECTSDVLDSYFSGVPPFKNRKNRDDFPDAFIWQIVNDVAGQQEKLFVIVADNNLRNAIRSISKTVVFETLDAFIQSQEVQELFPDSFIHNHANEIIGIFERDTAFLSNALYEVAVAEVEGTKISHRDDDEADIVDISKIHGAVFDCTDAWYYGQNIFRIGFEAEFDATLDYVMLKSALFKISDEEADIIEIQGPEGNESYMWVRENCILKTSGMLAISVDIPQLIIDSQGGRINEDSLKDGCEITLDQLDQPEVISTGDM
jgi:hypothetical protein